MRKTIINSTKIIAVSQFTKNEIIKILGIAKDKIVVIHNGVGSEYKILDQIFVEQRIERFNLKYKKYIGDKTYVYETDNLFYIVKNIKKNSNMLKILHINDIRN